MSWVNEEWKDGLSSIVLDQISKLEECVERVESEKKQFKFQVETANAVNEKLKLSESEKISEIRQLSAQLERSIAEFARAEDKIALLERELKEKDLLLERLKLALDNTQTAAEKKVAEAKELAKMLELLRDKYNTDTECLNTENLTLRKQVEEESKKWKNLKKAKSESDIDNEKEISNDIDKLVHENSQLRLLYESQRKTIEDLQSKLSGSEGPMGSTQPAEDAPRWSTEEINRLQEELTKAREALNGMDMLQQERDSLHQERTASLEQITNLKEQVNALMSDLEIYKASSNDVEKINHEKKAIENDLRALSMEVKAREDEMTKMLNDKEQIHRSQCDSMSEEMKRLQQRLEQYLNRNKELEHETSKLRARKVESRDAACLVHFADFEGKGLQNSEFASKEGYVAQTDVRDGHFSNLKDKIAWFRKNIAELAEIMQVTDCVESYSRDSCFTSDDIDQLKSDLFILSEALATYEESKAPTPECCQRTHAPEEGSVADGISPRAPGSVGKKKSERWNMEIFNLRLRVNELERKNKSLVAKLEGGRGVVGDLRKNFESPSSQDDKLQPKYRKPKEQFHCPQAKNLFPESRSMEDLLRANRISEEKLSILTNEKDRWERICKRKDETIQLLEKNMKFLAQERTSAENKLAGQLKARQDEIEALRSQLRDSDHQVKRLSVGKGVANEDAGGALGWRNLNSERYYGDDTGGYRSLSESSDALFDELHKSQEEDSDLRLLLNESYENLSYLDDILAGKYPDTLGHKFADFTREKYSLAKVRSADNVRGGGGVITHASSNDFREKFRKLREALKQIEARLSDKDKVNANLIRRIQGNSPRNGRTKDSSTQLGIGDIMTSPRGIANANALGAAGRRMVRGEKVFETWQSVETIASCLNSSENSTSSSPVDQKDMYTVQSPARQCGVVGNQPRLNHCQYQQSCMCKQLTEQLVEARGLLAAYEVELNSLKEANSGLDKKCRDEKRQCLIANETVQTVEKIAKEEYMKQEKLIVELETRLAHQVEKTQSALKDLDETKNQLRNHADQPLLESAILDIRNMIANKKGTEYQGREDLAKLQRELYSQLALHSDQVLEAIQKSAAKTIESCRSSRVGEGSPARNLGTSDEQQTTRPANAFHCSQYRSGNIGEDAYVTAKQVVGTLDELEKAKCSVCYAQDDVRMLLNTINKLEREKDKLNQECAGLLNTIQVKEGEIGKLTGLLEHEKNTVEDNEKAYQAELEVLKLEQIEVYKEFRDLCDSYKKKEFELSDKSKQVLSLEAQLRDYGGQFSDKVKSYEKELEKSRKENSNLRHDVDCSRLEMEEYLGRLKASKAQMTAVYQKLTIVDNMFYECRQKGLYK